MEANYFTILWWFLPYIHMNQSWVYMCSHPDPPSQPPSLSHHVLILYHIDALLLLLLLSRFSHVRLLATPWTAAYQAPPSMGFSRQEYRSGCHCLLRYRCITYLKFFFLPFKKNLASPTEGANFYFLDETPKTRSWQYPEVTAPLGTLAGQQLAGHTAGHTVMVANPLGPLWLLPIFQAFAFYSGSYIISEPLSSF